MKGTIILQDGVKRETEELEIIEILARDPKSRDWVLRRPTGISKLNLMENIAVIQILLNILVMRLLKLIRFFYCLRF